MLRSTEALKQAQITKPKQFEIADNPAAGRLKVAAGQIMKWTLLSGDKSIWRGVESGSIFSLKVDVEEEMKHTKIRTSSE